MKKKEPYKGIMTWDFKPLDENTDMQSLLDLPNHGDRPYYKTEKKLENQFSIMLPRTKNELINKALRGVI